MSVDSYFRCWLHLIWVTRESRTNAIRGDCDGWNKKPLKRLRTDCPPFNPSMNRGVSQAECLHVTYYPITCHCPYKPLAAD